jgi:hypothetical protein
MSHRQYQQQSSEDLRLKNNMLGTVERLTWMFMLTNLARQNDSSASKNNNNGPSFEVLSDAVANADAHIIREHLTEHSKCFSAEYLARKKSDATFLVSREKSHLKNGIVHSNGWLFSGAALVGSAIVGGLLFPDANKKNAGVAVCGVACACISLWPRWTQQRLGKREEVLEVLQEFVAEENK